MYSFHGPLAHLNARPRCTNCDRPLARLGELKVVDRDVMPWLCFGIFDLAGCEKMRQGKQEAEVMFNKLLDKPTCERCGARLEIGIGEVTPRCPNGHRPSWHI